ncbi:hypothetical protein GTA62_09955 [Roseobacter sp. HKCCD9010]|uniref:hypothetical protein n=1 Tax=unclassified Roseobacter TaxID=196798 RepID=UPI001490ADBC|nr:MULTISPECIES: hypothetical protein [unclassified Roseobacter]MBF9050968.1 hypothetical protein [Rhodobacterales bacterium HKCCD4356]NNV12737.1 hypothetical protein [Roseobacter sp. HKCCD7357]NNV16681.1 hypothetical protein [Roseobacter sp. HKCCD8768]NNV26687.1 hypothetical protein [Roseobacter sp. HKCCD8192]NNV30400.1 hypothetical protein [Roseobacter sp. HKCCD9061]
MPKLPDPSLATRSSMVKAEKARALLSLLGRDRFEALRQSGFGAPEMEADDVKSAEAPDDTLAWQRNRLIQRLRERGLLGGEPSLAEPLSTTATKIDPLATLETKNITKAVNEIRSPMGAESLVARLAANLNRSTIASEHPAVIAHLLKSQNTALRAQILRDLPGPHARAVMRYIGLL